MAKPPALPPPSGVSTQHKTITLSREERPTAAEVIAKHAAEEARSARSFASRAVISANKAQDAVAEQIGGIARELADLRAAIEKLAASETLEPSVVHDVREHLSMPPMPGIRSERVREIAKSITNEHELEAAREWIKWVGGIVAALIIVVGVYLLGRAGIK